LKYILGLIGIVIALYFFFYIKTQPLLKKEINSKQQQTEVPNNLVRTYKLSKQKHLSLKRYNKNIFEKEILIYYSKEFNKNYTTGCIGSLKKQFISRFIPDLWEMSQNLSPADPLVSNYDFNETIEHIFPQNLLKNGDVILYPGNKSLYLNVGEPGQDFFRDTGLHWKWIVEFIKEKGKDYPQLKELDPYAAEVLSEFISVYAVAILKRASINSFLETLDSNQITETFSQYYGESIKKNKLSIITEKSNKTKKEFSFETKEMLLKKYNKKMFLNESKKVKLNFTHYSLDKYQQLRSVVEIPFGIAGGGVAVSDYNNDGFDDIFLAGGGGGTLFKNNKGKNFINVNKTVGLKLSGESRAAYFVDYDNDGDQDLFISFIIESNRFFENEKGKFIDKTIELGLDTKNLVTHEAVWFDFDKDGLLDLYTASFGDWHLGKSPSMREKRGGRKNKLYHHVKKADGTHFFVEIGHKLGVSDQGWTHCVGSFDFNNDSFPDLFSFNDFGNSRFYENKSGKHFKDLTTSYQLDSFLKNAMNFAPIYLNSNSQPYFYVTEIMKLMHRQRYRKPSDNTTLVFKKETLNNLRALVNNKFLKITGKGENQYFSDFHKDFFEPSQMGWSWGLNFYDYENDGDLDALLLNGTEPKPPKLDPKIIEGFNDIQKQEFIEERSFISHYSMEQNICFINKDNFFFDLSKNCPPAFKGNSRSMAFFDFDNDGDQDLIINNYKAPAMFFKNIQNHKNNWIKIKLIGEQSNKNAIGTKVTISYKDKTQTKEVFSKSGFLSQESYNLHFGLGKAKKVDKIEIKWPLNQKQQIIENLNTNKTYSFKELKIK